MNNQPHQSHQDTTTTVPTSRKVSFQPPSHTNNNNESEQHIHHHHHLMEAEEQHGSAFHTPRAQSPLLSPRAMSPPPQRVKSAPASAVYQRPSTYSSSAPTKPPVLPTQRPSTSVREWLESKASGGGGGGAGGAGSRRGGSSSRRSTLLDPPAASFNSSTTSPKNITKNKTSLLSMSNNESYFSTPHIIPSLVTMPSIGSSEVLDLLSPKDTEYSSFKDLPANTIRRSTHNFVPSSISSLDDQVLEPPEDVARRLRPSLGAEWTKELKSSIEEIVSKALSDQQQREKKEEEHKSFKTKSCRRRSSRRRRKSSRSRSRSRSPSLASLIFDKIGVECGGEQCRDGDEEDCSRQPTPSTSDISKMIEYTNTTGFRTSVADARKVKDKIRYVLADERILPPDRPGGCLRRGGRGRHDCQPEHSDDVNQGVDQNHAVWVLLGMLACVLALVIIAFFTGAIRLRGDTPSRGQRGFA